MIHPVICKPIEANLTIICKRSLDDNGECQKNVKEEVKIEYICPPPCILDSTQLRSEVLKREIAETIKDFYCAMEELWNGNYTSTTIEERDRSELDYLRWTVVHYDSLDKLKDISMIAGTRINGDKVTSLDKYVTKHIPNVRKTGHCYKLSKKNSKKNDIDTANVELYDTLRRIFIVEFVQHYSYVGMNREPYYRERCILVQINCEEDKDYIVNVLSIGVGNVLSGDPYKPKRDEHYECYKPCKKEDCLVGIKSNYKP